ncbi:hypothetical protein [Jannaschia formosa]|uniref:hypothetical protein n=1 Tax=Jannaschia formosa TaxID=2259592 RepID=UPI001FD76307|nr:hypothetical protein [Jannaschia formosa]
MIVLLLLTPSLLLGGTSSQISDAILLLAIFGAAFVFVEYAAIYPGLIEFRDAPPFNRVRFSMLFLSVLLIALATRGMETPSTLTRIVQALGLLLGQSMDFPLSPIRLLMSLLPEGTGLVEAQIVRMAAGIAYLVSLVGLTVFAIMIRLNNWPSPTGSFNVWINLPTFDPTAGADVVKRLNRDGAVNIWLGLCLPYVSPPIAVFLARSYGVSMLDSDLLLVWTMALWAFFPASLFLRGIAMRRLALMISQKRRRYGGPGGDEDPAFLPA